MTLHRINHATNQVRKVSSLVSLTQNGRHVVKESRENSSDAAEQKEKLGLAEDQK